MSEPTRGDRDAACVAFLRWALPQMGMRWAGFRKVRRQVSRRVLRRAGELGLPDLAAYRTHLENHPDEWETLDGLACITISRFYDCGSLRDLPAPWRHAAFAPRDGRLCLRPHFRQPVSVVHHDLRSGTPDGPFDLVLCRNLAFTYCDTTLQRDVLAVPAHAVSPGGALVLGTHETLPDRNPWFAPWSPTPGVYHRTPLPATRHAPHAPRPTV
ncbi:MAG: CheR family methyltransferase [Solirubrobacteraceae bacterium]